MIFQLKEKSCCIFHFFDFTFNHFTNYINIISAWRNDHPISFMFLWVINTFHNSQILLLSNTHRDLSPIHEKNLDYISGLSSCKILLNHYTFPKTCMETSLTPTRSIQHISDYIFKEALSAEKLASKYYCWKMVFSFANSISPNVEHYNLKADVQIPLKWNPRVILWVGGIQDGSLYGGRIWITEG